MVGGLEDGVTVEVGRDGENGCEMNLMTINNYD